MFSVLEETAAAVGREVRCPREIELCVSSAVVAAVVDKEDREVGVLVLYEEYSRLCLESYKKNVDECLSYCASISKSVRGALRKDRIGMIYERKQTTLYLPLCRVWSFGT